ncbi:MAG: ribbon-helix-helix protein, CopG family [Anaerolineales bacterium]|jgi:metal-responsive CopG/Arc/MetJ family transcriptional regulator|nr:ribbon-helix-helix protein, CopG family [Anaerolineales bacterium]
MMKTVQMTIDEVLLTQVDTLVEALGTNRSAFMREALESALKQRQVKVLEEQHRAGYERQPLTPDEFDIWQEEQVWGSTP